MDRLPSPTKSDPGLDPRDRVLRAITHRQTDRPPLGEICIDTELVKAYLGCPDVGFSELRDYSGLLGLDLICLQAPSLPLDTLTPDPHKGGWPLWADLERWSKESKTFVFCMLNGGFSQGIAAMGFMDFMLAISRKKERVEEIFRQTATYNVTVGQLAVDRGAQAIIIADDIAHNGGAFVSGSFLDRCYFPSLSPFLEKMNALGVRVFLHSDGDLRKILPSIVNAGFSGLQGLEEASGMDLAALKRDYGGKLCLWGNLDPAYLVNSTDPDEIEQQVQRVMRTGAAGGGFIFGTSSGLFRGMRQDNLSRVYKVAKEFRTSSTD